MPIKHALSRCLIFLLAITLVACDVLDEAVLDKSNAESDQRTQQVDVNESSENNEFPTPAKASSTRPLRNRDTSALNGKPYTFIAKQEGSDEPVAYDPCRPIKVVINNRTAIKDAERMVREAMDRVTAVSGLVFEVEGITAEKPTDNRRSYQPERYGDRWAPVLLAWSDPKEIADLRGDTTGLAGSSWVDLPGEEELVYVSGDVILDGPQMKEIVEDEGWAVARSVVMHELGHLVGLDHVEDITQIMHPEGDPSVTEFKAGDKAGLARLGGGSCFREL